MVLDFIERNDRDYFSPSKRASCRSGFHREKREQIKKANVQTNLAVSIAPNEMGIAILIDGCVTCVRIAPRVTRIRVVTAVAFCARFVARFPKRL
jgi:hypothetical protein